MSDQAAAGGSHRLREGDELVEGFAPTVVEAHVCVFFGGFLIAVDRDRGVLRSGAVRFEQDHRGKERYAGCALRAIAGLERGGPDEFLVLGDFEVAADIGEFLSLRRAHDGPEDTAGAQVDLAPDGLPWRRG